MDVSKSIHLEGVQGEVPIKTSLQSGTVDDLIVNSELATAIVDDQNTNTTTAIGEGLIES